MTSILDISNTIDISTGNFYTISNKNVINKNTNQQYNIARTEYSFFDIPKLYPLGFYIEGSNNNSNILDKYVKVTPIINNSINIYVSRGNDISYNNGDYFRFYDESNNLINIIGAGEEELSNNTTELTGPKDNFYFMHDVTYTFIAAYDFSNITPFGISGSNYNTNELNSFKLQNIDDTFSITISGNNNNNRIYYYDLNNHQNVSGNLEILIDNSGYKYYYGDICLNFLNSELNTSIDISLSIRSYPKYGLISDISDISNINPLFNRIEDKYNYSNVINAFYLKTINGEKFLPMEDDNYLLEQYWYKLNFNTDYIEPGYELIFNAEIIDEISYNSHLIELSMIDVSRIEQRYTLNYFFKQFIIDYVANFQDKKFIGKRFVEIVYEPIIDFNIATYFPNLSITNHFLDNIINIDLSRNYNSSELDNLIHFIYDPNFYIYDISKNKYDLKSNISFSRKILTENFDFTRTKYVNTTTIDIDEILNDKIPRYSNVINFNGKKYYLSSFLGKEIINGNYVIRHYNIDNNIETIDNSNILIDLINNAISIKNSSIIDICNNTSTINFITHDLSYNIDLMINDFSFQIDMSSNYNDDKQDFKGEFDKDNFFKREIDFSYISQYTFEYQILGLEPSDYIYHALSNNDNQDNDIINAINNFPTNVSFTINVIDDIIISDICFQNANLIYNTTISHDLYRQSLSFDLINDICFNNIINGSTSREANSVNIFYNENSLYIPDLSYTIESSNNMKQIKNLVSIDNSSSDASMVIIYHLDFSSSYYTNINSIHGISFEQRSSDISLVLSYFSDSSRPFISLSGEQIVKLQYKEELTYLDDGLNIYINNNHYFLDLSNEISMNNGITNISNGTINNNNNNNNNHISLFTDIIANVSVQDIGKLFEISFNYDIDLERENNNINFDCSYGGNIIQSLTRRIKIVDETAPVLRLLKDFSNIVDLSNGRGTSDFNFNVIDGNLEDISSGNVATLYMDISYTYDSNYSDLSNILFDISYSDNKDSDISVNYQVKVPPLTDFSNTDSELLKITLSNENYLSDDFSFIKTSKDIANNKPIEIKYVLTDHGDNVLNYIRKIYIVDITPPTITFFKPIDMSFIYFTNDISDRRNYVNYSDSDLFTISYEAINRDFSLEMFKSEISNILYNFNISDNYSSREQISNNYNLTFIHPDLSNYDITKPEYIFDNSNIYSKFSKIDSSFKIHYEISDSQNNDNSFNRIINIVNNIPPNIEFINKTPNHVIEISFGDTNYDFLLNDIRLFHPRLGYDLLDIDLSFQNQVKKIIRSDLSYNITINSLSGEKLYDPSSIIYTYEEGRKEISLDISFFSVYQSVSSQEILSEVKIKIDNPNFIIKPSSIICEAGIPITDLSIINGVSVYSKFDEFKYYQSNSGDISYTFSKFNFYIENIDISIQNFLNNPFYGKKDIIYELSINQLYFSDQRTLDIIDTTPPYLDLTRPIYNIDDYKLEKLSNNYYIIEVQEKDLSKYNFKFKDDGIGIQSISFNLTTEVNGILEDNTDSSFVDLSSPNNTNNIYELSNNTIISNYLANYTRILDNYRNVCISFNIFDKEDNNYNIEIKINIIKNYQFIPYINIFDSSFDLLLNNFSHNKVNNPSIPNDISLTFNSDLSLIIMEALRPEVYNTNISFGILTSNENKKESKFNYYIIETPQIISNIPNIYKIFFVYYDDSGNNGNIEYDLSIINTKLPEISFNNNNNLYNIENNIQTNQDFSLIIPLLHKNNESKIDSFQDLTRNQQYFTRKKYNKLTDTTIYQDTSINLTEIILNDNYQPNYILYNENYQYSQDISFIFKNDLSNSDISEIYFSLEPNPNIVNTISAPDFSFNKSAIDASTNINISINKSYNSIDLCYSILYNISNKKISSFINISNKTTDYIINNNNTIELSYNFINGKLTSSEYDVSTNQDINIRFIDFNKYEDISDINIDISGNNRFTLDRNDNNNNIIFLESSFNINSDPIDLSYTINYKIRNPNRKGNIFKEEKEQEIYSIPGVNFDDIVDGRFSTTINETIDTIFPLKDKYKFSISYELIEEISGILKATKYPLNETELSFNSSYIDTSYISNRQLFTRHLLKDTNNISINRRYLYKQIYNLFDLSLNKGLSFERIIKLQKVTGYFELNYTNITDNCNNIYVEHIYHKKNQYYIDYGGQFKSFENPLQTSKITRNNIDNMFNENLIGKQNFNYKIGENTKNISLHVIDIKNFPKENNNFITELSKNIINHHITNTNFINNLKTNIDSSANENNIIFIDSNIKYGLHDNSYIINLISSIDISYYIRLFQYDYAKNERKYAKDLIDLSSNSSYNQESNYKDGVITLTVNSDFLICSLELLMINKSNPNDISSIIYKDLFIYDEKSKYINVEPIKKMDNSNYDKSVNTYLDNCNNLYEENIIVKVEKQIFNKQDTINLNDNIYHNQNFQSNYILNNIGSSQNIKFIFDISQSDISEIYFSLERTIQNSILVSDFSFNKSNPDTSINIDISINTNYINIDLNYSILYDISNKKISNFIYISNETTDSTIELSYNFINGKLTSSNDTYDVTLNNPINIRFIDFNKYKDISDINIDISNKNFTLHTDNDNKDISFSDSPFNIGNTFDLSYTINYKIRNPNRKGNIFTYRKDLVSDDKKVYNFLLQDGTNITNVFHLCNGKYIFDQSNSSNFLNPIHFSYIEDGVHNVSYNWIDFEYTKNIKRIKIPGQSDAKTILYLDATTPSPLYFYNRNIPNSGGKIITKNNIILSKDFISLNSPVITRDLDNDAVYPNLKDSKDSDNKNIDLDNKIILSYNNYQSNTSDPEWLRANFEAVDICGEKLLPQEISINLLFSGISGEPKNYGHDLTLGASDQSGQYWKIYKDYNSNYTFPLNRFNYNKLFETNLYLKADLPKIYFINDNLNSSYSYRTSNRIMVPFYGISNDLINYKNDFYKWTHLYIFDISDNYNSNEPSGNYIKLSPITQPGNITIDSYNSDISYIDISYLPNTNTLHRYNIGSINFKSCNYFANFDGSKFITENNTMNKFDNSKLNFNNYYLNQNDYSYNTFDISLTETDLNILLYGKTKNNIYTYSRDLNFLFYIHSTDNTNTANGYWYPNIVPIDKDISSTIKIYRKNNSNGISYEEILSIVNNVNGLTPVFYNYDEYNLHSYTDKIQHSLYNIFVNEDSLLNVQNSSIMDNCINIVTIQGLGYISDNYNPNSTLIKNYVTSDLSNINDKTDCFSMLYGIKLYTYDSSSNTIETTLSLAFQRMYYKQNNIKLFSNISIHKDYLNTIVNRKNIDITKNFLVYCNLPISEEGFIEKNNINSRTFYYNKESNYETLKCSGIYIFHKNESQWSQLNGVPSDIWTNDLSVYDTDTSISNNMYIEKVPQSNSDYYDKPPFFINFAETDISLIKTIDFDNSHNQTCYYPLIFSFNYNFKSFSTFEINSNKLIISLNAEKCDGTSYFFKYLIENYNKTVTLLDYNKSYINRYPNYNFNFSNYINYSNFTNKILLKNSTIKEEKVITEWQWLRYINSWQKISYIKYNDAIKWEYINNDTSYKTNYYGGTNDYIKYFDKNENIETHGSSGLSNYKPLVNPFFDEPYPSFDIVNSSAFIHYAVTADERSFLIDFDKEIFLSGFRQTGSSNSGIVDEGNNKTNIKDLRFYYFNGDWKEIENVSGSTHSIKPLKHWSSYDINRKNLKIDNYQTPEPAYDLNSLDNSYSYFELSNNTLITISNDDLSNLNMDSLNTVMSSKGYYYKTDIYRMIIGRNIKEITSTNNGTSGAINLDNSFSIIFLPRESNDVIIINNYAFYNCTTLIDVTFTNYMNIGLVAFKETGIIHLDLSPIENYTTIEDDTFTYLNNLKSINFGTYLQEIRSNFSDCPKLLEIIIPSNITIISDSRGFKNNDNLTTVKFLERDNSLNIISKCFDNNKRLHNVYYNDIRFDSYQDFSNNSDFSC